MDYWPLQDAKARLSEMVKKVVSHGSLGISVRGKKEIILLSKKKYDSLIGKKKTFLEFITASPLSHNEVKCERDRSSFREIDL